MFNNTEPLKTLYVIYLKVKQRNIINYESYSGYIAVSGTSRSLSHWKEIQYNSIRNGTYICDA